MKRLNIGEYGEITYSTRGRSTVAAVFYRDHSGRRRRLRRDAPTRAAARRALMKELNRVLEGGEYDSVAAAMPLQKAAAAWLLTVEDRVTRGTRSPSTLDLYRHAVERHIVPGVGELLLVETTTARLDRFLQGILRSKGYATAKLCRTVLSGICSWAVRMGGLPFNPVRDVTPLELDRDRTAKAMTPDEVRRWLEHLDGDVFARRHELAELSRFVLATGVRLGEALGVRWSDVDLDRGILSVERTIIRVRGKGPMASRLKSRSSYRVLVLPGWCLTMLRSRRAGDTSVDGPVFPDAKGGYRDRSNVGAAFRRARAGTEFEWVTPHTYRKTVATLLDSSGASARMIADQLGHSRISMTQDVYMGRRSVSPAMAAALESLENPVDKND